MHNALAVLGTLFISIGVVKITYALMMRKGGK
jgi:hypothetical protein